MVRNGGVEQVVNLRRSHAIDLKVNATGVSLYCRGVVVVCDGYANEGPVAGRNDAVPPGARDLRSSNALDEFLTERLQSSRTPNNPLSTH